MEPRRSATGCAVSDLAIDADASWLDAFREQHGTRHLIAFSRGKDAVAAYLVARERGLELVPFHMYIVPDLEFIAESLDYYERALGVRIINIPHPSLFRMLDACVFQPPEHVQIIDRIDPCERPYTEVYGALRRSEGLPDTALTASGVRACDSLVRRISFRRSGHIRPKSQTFYPVWNFNKAATLSVIARAGIDLAIDYELFGRSFDGIDHRFLAPLKRHRPRDYARILEWFPLADLELFRHGLLRQAEQSHT